MKILSRATLAASAFKLTGLAAVNAEAAIVTNTFAPVVIANNINLGSNTDPTVSEFDVNGDGSNDLKLAHVSYDQNTDDGLVNAATFAMSTARFTAIGPFAMPTASGSTPADISTYKAVGQAILAYSTDNTGGGNTRENMGFWSNGGTTPLSGSGEGYRGFLGFTFLDGNGAEHYGWADVGVKAYDGADLTSFETTVYSTSYDTVPIPEPTSLALLAMGAAGLLARRRRDVKLAA